MDDCYAVFFKPSVATNISLWSITHVMTRTVDLDRETCFCAVKIKYEWLDGMLTSEHWLSR